MGCCLFFSHAAQIVICTNALVAGRQKWITLLVNIAIYFDSESDDVLIGPTTTICELKSRF